jgi:DNA-binding NarL/FixJ family response regulator
VKTVCFDELLTAVRTIETGGVYLSPEISGMVVGEFRELLKKNTEISAFSLLSDREKQILQCISEGRTTKEIAYLIKISTKTVETHRRNIMDKVGVNTIAGLTRYAIQEGICSL